MTNNRWSRDKPTKLQKRMFLIASEGSKTERSYFYNAIRKFADSTLVQICVIRRDNKSAPLYVLKDVEKAIKDQPLETNDEAWLVVDRDKWTDDQLKNICDWTKKSSKYNRGLALSNPAFEYWVLLHFCDGSGVTSQKDCISKLERYMPFEKDFESAKQLSLDMVRSAIKRAKIKDNPPRESYPTNNGSTVYRLIERILDI